MRTANMDMLHGPLAKKLLLFTAPIALSSMVQQLFNAADIAVVGLLASESALAAVGTNTEIVALIVTVSSGLSMGANILLANQFGRDERDKMSDSVQTAVFLAVLTGVVGMFAGLFSAEYLLRWIQTPDGIFSEAVQYLRIYLLGYPFLLLYDFASAVLRAQGDSRYPFMALVISGGMNVGLNLFFVLVFRLGVVGVALATDISNALSAWIVLRQLKKDELYQFRFHRPTLRLHMVGEILKTGIPAALQGAVFCFANIFVQASVNRFGETAIAGSTVAMNFEYFTYYIITAFGQAATTFTSQNYAAGQRVRCRCILRQCLLLSTVCSSIPIFVIVLFRKFFAGFFTPETAVIVRASERILCILLFEPICNFYEIPAGVLRGSGRALWPAAGTMIGTCAFRIVWICTVFRRNPSLPVLYRAFPLSWVVTVLLVNIGFGLWKPFGEKKR